MSEDGEARFREPKTVYEERELVKNAIPSSTKYEQMGSNNFWRMENFSVVIAPVLDPGGLFKGYDLHKVARLSTSIEEMDTVNLNY